MINSLFGWLKPRLDVLDANAEGDAGDVAKKRLQFLLIQDRAHLPPQQMENLRKDILEVLSRYVEVDTNSLEISLEHMPESRQMAIISNIPFKRILSGNKECLDN